MSKILTRPLYLIVVLGYNVFYITLGLNREVKIEYKKLKEKVKEYNKKDAKFYSNMLAKMLEPHVSSF